MKNRWKRVMHGAALGLVLLGTPLPGWALDNEDCLGCHGDADQVGQALVIDRQRFDYTAHAQLGCSGCHLSVSETHPDDGLPPSKPGCGACHDEVFRQYALGAHGSNAQCRDCHTPHKVRPAADVSGHEMNRTCASCHQGDDTLASHARWLPQAGLHLENLPCVSCHSGSKERQISLYIIPAKGPAQPLDYEALSRAAGGQDVAAIIDGNGDGYISLTELRLFNQGSDRTGLRLQGMMMPLELSHDFRTLDDKFNCSACHALGPEAMQVSRLCLPRPDGSFSPVEVEKGAVLDALHGTPDFYMVGATRSAALDLIGLMVVAGGLVMPLGHGTLRFFTRKNRSHRED